MIHWRTLTKNISIPTPDAGAVSYCSSLTLRDMLRLPGGWYEIAPESQAWPKGNQAPGGNIGGIAALRPVSLRRGARHEAKGCGNRRGGKVWCPRSRFREEDLVKVIVGYSEGGPSRQAESRGG
jgi:hypothetical protein